MAVERLCALLAQCDEDTNGTPGWVLRRLRGETVGLCACSSTVATLRRLRGETVAYRKTDDPYWRIPTGTPLRVPQPPRDGL